MTEQQRASEGDTAYIGLRSGNVLAVKKTEKGAEVDVSRVLLSDVALGMSWQARFAGQLYREPYSVAEHSVLGSYLFEDPVKGLQFLFHDVAEGLGFPDTNFKVKRLFGKCYQEPDDAVTFAVAAKYGVKTPFDPSVHEVDQMMGGYECMTLHPAKNAIARHYGLDIQKILDQPTPAQKEVLQAWFSRAPIPPRAAADQWLRRYHELRLTAESGPEIRRLVEAFVADKENFPHPVKLMVPKLAASMNVRPELVQQEVDRLERKGMLVRRDIFYHVARA
jgi:hypothetical protein